AYRSCTVCFVSSVSSLIQFLPCTMPAMKLQHSLRIIFSGALIALMGACATTPMSGPTALAGTWTNSLGTVCTINADGTFHVTSTAPKAAIWGKYTVTGETI